MSRTRAAALRAMNAEAPLVGDETELDYRCIRHALRCTSPVRRSWSQKRFALSPIESLEEAQSASGLPESSEENRVNLLKIEERSDFKVRDTLPTATKVRPCGRILPRSRPAELF